MTEPFDTIPDELEGEKTVEVRCDVVDHDPELCDGWKDTFELDAEPEIDDDGFLRLPGLSPVCDQCGNPHTFEINGVRTAWGL